MGPDGPRAKGVAVYRTRHRGLSVLLSAALVASLVPAPALAEVADDLQPTPTVREEVAPEEQVTEPAVREVQEPAGDTGDAAAMSLMAQSDGGNVPDEGITQREGDADGTKDESSDDQAAMEEPPTEQLLVAADEGTAIDEVMALDAIYDVHVDEGGFWLGSFTAPEEGTYIFESTGDCDTYGHLYADEELDVELTSNDDGGENGSFKILHVLNAGETVYLKARRYDDGEADFFVGVTRLDVSDLSQGGLNYTENEFPYTHEAVVPVVSVYDYEGNELVEGTDYELVYYIYQGWDDETQEHVYVKLDGAPSDVGTYYLAAHGIGAYHGETGKYNFSIIDHFDMASFETYLESYEFDLADGPVQASMRVINDNGDELVEGTDYELVYFTESGWDEETGETIYTPLDGAPTTEGNYYVAAVGIDPYHGRTSSMYSITVTAPIEQVDMEVDADYEVRLFGDDDYWLGNFTAPQDGTYVFRSTGSVDTYGELYADEQLENCLASSDGSGTDSNFRLSQSLEAGETVHLKVRSFGGSDTFWVSCALDDGRDLSDCFISWQEGASFVETGEPVELGDALRVYREDSETPLDPEDYELIFWRFDNASGEETLLDGAPSAVGQYYVAARGTGYYHGETSLYSFVICAANDLAGAHINLSSSYLELTGEPVDLAPYVTVTAADGTELTLGEHYMLRYWVGDDDSCDVAPSEAGCYDVCAVAIDGGGYVGHTNWWSYDLWNPNDISESVWTESWNDITRFAGGDTPLELPEYTLYRTKDGQRVYASVALDHYEVGQEIDDDEDYYDSWAAIEGVPSEPGRYRAVYAGVAADGFSGTRYAYITLRDARDIQYFDHMFWPNSWVDVSAAEPALPTSVLYRDGRDDAADDADDTALLRLTEGTDYRLARIESADGEQVFADGSIPTEPGRYYAVYEGIDRYHGERREQLDFYDGRDIGRYAVSLKESLFAYTGEAIAPEVRIARDDTWLVEGEDFVYAGYRTSGDELTEGYPSAVGSYQLVFKGVGAYGGTASIGARITDGKDLSHATLQLENRHVQASGITAELRAKVIDDLGNTVAADAYDLVFFKGQEAYDENDGSWYIEYTELDEAPSVSGDYYVSARAKDSSGYTGETDKESLYVIGSSVEVEPIVMTLDEQLDVTCEADSFWLGKFTAPEDGIYAFASAGAQDSFAYLFADAGLEEWLTSDDDSGEGNNFRIVRSLEEGESVWLQVNHCDYETLSCKVNVIRADGYDLANGELYDSTYRYAATGSAIVPDVEVYDAMGEMLPTSAYILEYQDDDGNAIDAVVEPGYYNVRAVALEGSGYTGATRWNSIRVLDAASLATATLLFADEQYCSGTGEAVELNASLYDVADRLVPADAYTLVYRVREDGLYLRMDGAPTTAGNYQVRAVAKEGSGYTGHTAWRGFEVYATHDIASSSVHMLDYDYYDYMTDLETYLQKNGVVTPRVEVRVSSGDDSWQLTEGVDYTVAYEGADQPSTYGRAATATVTGIGDYTGTLTLHFGVARTAPIDAYLAGHGANVEHEGVSWWDYGSELGGYARARFLATGEPICPKVSFGDAADGEPVEGTDFTVRYVDADGNDATPTEPGYYAILLTATPTSEFCTGTAYIPFRLTATRHMAENGMSYLPSVSGFEVQQYPNSDNTWTVDAFFDEIENVVWTVRDGMRSLTEDVNYKVKILRDNAEGFIKFVFTGVGSYTYSVSRYVYATKPARIDVSTATVKVANATYTGKALTPNVTVSVDGVGVLEKGVDYTLSYKDNVNAGTGSVTVSGEGAYKGTKVVAFTIAKASSKISLAAQTKTYTGKALAYSGKVTKSGSSGKVTYAYYSDAKCTKAVKAANVIKAGTYYVRATVAADDNFKAATSAAVKFTVAKAAQPMTAKTRTATLAYSKVKAANQKLAAAKVVTVTKNQGTVSYKKISGNAKITVASNGTVTVKKGLAKGKYKVKVRVTAKGNANYKSGYKDVTFTIVVK